MKDVVKAEKLVPFLVERGYAAARVEDGDVVRRAMHADLPTADLDQGEAVIRASTDALDSYDDVLLQDGCILDEFLTRGVIPIDHDYSATKIVARPIGVIKSDHATDVKIKFGSTPACQEILQLMRDGVLRGVSVGFQVLDAVVRGGPGWDKAVAKLTHLTDEARRAVVRIVTKWRLLEVSIVGLGSNPEALVMAVKSASPEARRILGATETKGEGTAEVPPAPAPAAEAPPAPEPPAPPPEPPMVAMTVIAASVEDLRKRNLAIKRGRIWQ